MTSEDIKHQLIIINKKKKKKTDLIANDMHHQQLSVPRKHPMFTGLFLLLTTAVDIVIY